MEWLENNIVAPILATVLAFISAKYWYDTNARDARLESRFKKGDIRMRELELKVIEVDKHLIQNTSQHEVLRATLEGLKELIDNRMDTMSDSMNRIEDVIMRSKK